MLFNSWGFLLFFLVVLAGLQLLQGDRHHVARKRFLVGASYFFYATWSPPFLLLLAFSTVVDFSLARAMVGTTGRRRAALLGLSLVANLGLLGFFKYGNFFAGVGWSLVHGWSGAPPVFLRVVLPLGISFYTFETLAYMIDVYRGAQPADSLLDYAFFISFFPHLVAGPIVRPDMFLPQLAVPPRPDARAQVDALRLIVVGLFKKVVCADLLGEYVASVYVRPDLYAGIDALIGIYAYAFQIYFDFSGYSDIAIGLAGFLGYRLPQNFDRPYAAPSIAEFWRRWHMTLSSWLRDYLYISLGGNRRGGARTYMNVLVTMVLGGLWHGANYTFVLWGAYHGTLLALHRALREGGWLERLPAAGMAGRLVRVASVLLTFHLVALGFALFRAESVRQFATLLGAVGWGFPRLSTRQVGALAVLSGAALVHALGPALGRAVALGDRPAWMQGAVYAALTLVALLFAPGGAPFIYFQF